MSQSGLRLLTSFVDNLADPEGPSAYLIFFAGSKTHAKDRKALEAATVLQQLITSPCRRDSA